MNRITISGYMANEAELKLTPSGVEVISFDVSVKRAHSKEKVTDYIPCVAWRNTATFVSKYFAKGKPIEVDGSIQTRTYTDKNGNKRKAVEIVVDNVSFPPRDGSEPVRSSTDVEFEEVDDGELPF